jgi:hypothetical protein
MMAPRAVEPVALPTAAPTAPPAAAPITAPRCVWSGSRSRWQRRHGDERRRIP